MQQLQQQMQVIQQENQVLHDRLEAAERAAASSSGGPAIMDAGQVLQALKDLPEAISKLKDNKKTLIDTKGLGKPQILGDNAEQKFRLWAIKLEDYVAGVFTGKSREALEFAAGNDTEVTEADLDINFGASADLNDQWDDIKEFDARLYTILRATTEGIPFDLVENVVKGRGLEAWRLLHRKYDPNTGGRKRVILNALANPERSSFDNLGAALERWKSLRSRYNRKKDQFGLREQLPESLAMNALEKLVPKELETHLLLNYSRFKTFEDMESEVVTYMEAKTGSKLTVSGNFSKPSGGDSAPMDVDSLVKAVSGSISSLVAKGGGKSPNKINVKFDGNCDNCGKYGHRKKDCWNKTQGQGKGKPSRTPSSSPQKQKFDGKCNNCGKQ